MAVAVTRLLLVVKFNWLHGQDPDKLAKKIVGGVVAAVAILAAGLATLLVKTSRLRSQGHAQGSIFYEFSADCCQLLHSRRLRGRIAATKTAPAEQHSYYRRRTRPVGTTVPTCPHHDRFPDHLTDRLLLQPEHRPHGLPLAPLRLRSHVRGDTGAAGLCPILLRD